MEKINAKRYSSYKDTGENWIGEIPSHWDVKPGFTVVGQRSEKNTGLIESTVLTLSYGQVKIKPEEKLTGLVPESFETYQIVYPGDIIIRPTDLQNDKISLRTGLAKNKGIITSAYINLKVKNNYSSSYFHYFLYAIDITKMIYGLGTGLRQNLGYREFKRFNFLVPPVEEQNAIAHFLDKRIALADQTIRIKKKQIELLKQRKQILIQRAITKGLNPKIKLKDSGVEWIDKIPEHWEIKPLKYLGSMYPGITGKGGEDFSKEKVNEMKPFIPFTTIFRHDVITLDEFQYVRINGYENQNLVKKHDLLFLMSSETLDDIGKCAIYLGEEKELYLNSFCKGFRFSSGKINPSFVNYLLLCKAYREYLSVVGRGFTRINLKQEHLNSLPVIIPSLDEQMVIVNYIDKINNNTHNSISIRINEIEKLKEYKASLINSAVTGKIKVC